MGRFFYQYLQFPHSTVLKLVGTVVYSQVYGGFIALAIQNACLSPSNLFATLCKTRLIAISLSSGNIGKNDSMKSHVHSKNANIRVFREVNNIVGFTKMKKLINDQIIYSKKIPV